jgi:serine phosphatase RsbU (regulator of sigma subunit)
LVDKLFYSERYNYQQALLEYSRELPRLLELDEVLKSIITRISDTMHVERMAVVLCDTIEGCRTIRRGISEQDCSFNDKEGSLIELLRRTKTPQILDIQDETIMTKLTAEDQRRIIECGIVLAVPLILQDRLIGIIVVGPKLSGRMYSQEDIALLTTVSNQAAVAIENSRLHIAEIEKKKYEEELAIARRIQQGLLPKDVPKIKGLEISGVSVPAMTVGGDYYDFIQLDSKRLLVVVADVSGKGMSAALYMSKIQGMIQFAATMHSSPKDILIQVNKLIFESLERKSFITMIAALFDLNKKKVTICRAGHNKAIVSTKKGLQHLSAVGIGLGLEKGSLFENKLEEVHCPVKSNSLFVFYTDGLTEAMNRERSEFGEERVLELLKKNSHSSVNDIQSTILNDVETFRAGAEQNDDLTLVVVKGK